MKYDEALDRLKGWVEYITRIDYVEPIIRNEVKDALIEAYENTTDEFRTIEKALKVLDILIKAYDKIYYLLCNSYYDGKYYIVSRVDEYDEEVYFKITREDYYLIKDLLEQIGANKQ